MRSLQIIFADSRTLTIPIVDVAILVSYLIGVVCFGLWLGRGQRNIEGYFLGNRNLPWWAVLGSIVATETSTATFLSIPGMAFDANEGDLRFLQLAIGYIVGRMAVAVWILPRYFQGALFTAYELLEQRFGTAARTTASILFLITRNFADGLRLYLAAIALDQVLPLDLPICVLIIGVLTIIYTVAGGLRSVVWNDCIQLVVYSFGAVAAMWVVGSQLPDGWRQVVEFGQDHQKFRVLDWAFDPSRAYTVWAGVIGGAFLTMATHGSDQMMVQRFLGARNQGAAARALVLSGFVVLSQFAVFLMLGVGLAAFYDQFPPPNPFAATDEVFPAFIANHLPSGIRGLTLAAVFAAAMSTLSSSLNSSASTAYNDLIRPWGGRWTNARTAMGISRLLTVIFGIVQITVGVSTSQIVAAAEGMYRGNVVSDVLAIAGFTSGVILGVFLLGFATRSVTQRGALVGIWSGLAIMSFVKFGTPIAWTWHAVIGAMTTLTIGWLTSYWRKGS